MNHITMSVTIASTFPRACTHLNDEHASVQTSSVVTLREAKLAKPINVTEEVKNAVGRHGKSTSGDTRNGLWVGKHVAASHQSISLRSRSQPSCEHEELALSDGERVARFL